MQHPWQPVQLIKAAQYVMEMIHWYVFTCIYPVRQKKSDIKSSNLVDLWEPSPVMKAPSNGEVSTCNWHISRA